MVLEGLAQLGDASSGLTLDVSGAAAECHGDVLDTQVLDVPQDHCGPHPGRQGGQGGEQVRVPRGDTPGCRDVGERLGCALSAYEGTAPVVDERVDQDAPGVRLDVARPCPSPGEVEADQRALD